MKVYDENNHDHYNTPEGSVYYSDEVDKVIDGDATPETLASPPMLVRAVYALEDEDGSNDENLARIYRRLALHLTTPGHGDTHDVAQAQVFATLAVSAAQEAATKYLKDRRDTR